MIFYESGYSVIHYLGSQTYLLIPLGSLCSDIVTTHFPLVCYQRQVPTKYQLPPCMYYAAGDPVTSARALPRANDDNIPSLTPRGPWQDLDAGGQPTDGRRGTSQAPLARLGGAAGTERGRRTGRRWCGSIGRSSDAMEISVMTGRYTFYKTSFDVIRHPPQKGKCILAMKSIPRYQDQLFWWLRYFAARANWVSLA